MLLNSKGQQVQIPHIPEKSKNREAILAPLTEVLIPDNHKCGKMFNIQTRARFRNE